MSNTMKALGQATEIHRRKQAVPKAPCTLRIHTYITRMYSYDNVKDS